MNNKVLAIVGFVGAIIWGAASLFVTVECALGYITLKGGTVYALAFMTATSICTALYIIRTKFGTQVYTNLEKMDLEIKLLHKQIENLAIKTDTKDSSIN